jgi:NAD-dependent SIR2 family protein deacetylase
MPRITILTGAGISAESGLQTTARNLLFGLGAWGRC